MTFILDANVFIEAKNRYYAFDICPGFWTWMDHIVASGNVQTITKVRDELIDGNDELKDWVAARKTAPWFLSVDDRETQSTLGSIASFIQSERYKPAAKNKFLSKADPWLIAKAVTTGATVVTHEEHRPEATKTVPIPNICHQFGVRWVNTFDLLRTMTASFVFEPE